MAAVLLALRRNRAFALAVRATRPLRQRCDVSYLYHFDLHQPVPDLRASIAVEVKRASRVEVEEAALLVSPDLRETFLARLDNGMACFVATVGGRVVAYNWTRYLSGWDEGDAVELGPGEIYTTDAFTAESFRGRKIHTETLAHMLQAARAAGYLDAFTMASALKPGSRKTMRRIGWRLAGRVVRVRIGGGRYRVLRLTGSTRPLSPPPRSGAAAS